MGVLSITNDTIIESFGRHAQNVAAVSLAIGMPTQASVHHSVLNAFKHLACASFASSFGFKEADKLKAAAGSRPAASSAPAEAKKEVKKEEDPMRKSTSIWATSSATEPLHDFSNK